MKKTNGVQSAPAKVTGSGSGDVKTFDRRMLSVVFVTLLIDLLAFTLILPLLPALLDYYGQNDEVSPYFTLINRKKNVSRVTDVHNSRRVMF